MWIVMDMITDIYVIPTGAPVILSFFFIGFQHKKGGMTRPAQTDAGGVRS